MTIEAIKTAIEGLTDPEVRDLTHWLAELRESAWDRQLEEDFQPGGRGQFLVDEALADIAAGRTQPLQELLAECKTFVS